MANDCNFSMAIHGAKKDIETFYKWLGALYDYTDGKNIVEFEGEPVKHHIGYRVFEVFGLDMDDNENLDDAVAYCSGYCAWSVHSCMFDGDCSYIADNKDKGRKAISITDASKLLNLDIEVFSEEPGMEFSEHYIIRKGEVELDDCVDLVTYFDENDEYHIESDHHDKWGDYIWEM